MCLLTHVLVRQDGQGPHVVNVSCIFLSSLLHSIGCLLIVPKLAGYNILHANMKVYVMYLSVTNWLR